MSARKFHSENQFVFKLQIPLSVYRIYALFSFVLKKMFKLKTFTSPKFQSTLKSNEAKVMRNKE